MNANVLEKSILTVPNGLLILTTIIISLTILLSVVGASTLVPRLVFFSKKPINSWWIEHVFRDTLADQFSWSAIVITACLSEVVDVDFAQWGGSVVAIMTRAKSFVLDWFVVCTDRCEPNWVSVVSIVFWCVTFVSVALRIVQVITRIAAVHLNAVAETTMAIIQSMLTAAGFILMPAIGFSLVFLDKSSYAGFSYVLCIVLLFICQPLQRRGVSRVIGIAASIFNSLVPVGVCIAIGFGMNFLSVFIAALVCCVLLPLVSTTELWFSFFFNTSRPFNSAWKHSICWTLGLRTFSMVCGVAFITLMYFQLSETVSKVASALWVAWICLPFFAIIPLAVGVPSVLSVWKEDAHGHNNAPDDDDDDVVFVADDEDDDEHVDGSGDNKPIELEEMADLRAELNKKDIQLKEFEERTAILADVQKETERLKIHSEHETKKRRELEKKKKKLQEELNRKKESERHLQGENIRLLQRLEEQEKESSEKIQSLRLEWVGANKILLQQQKLREKEHEETVAQLQETVDAQDRALMSQTKQLLEAEDEITRLKQENNERTMQSLRLQCELSQGNPWTPDEAEKDKLEEAKKMVEEME